MQSPQCEIDSSNIRSSRIRASRQVISPSEFPTALLELPRRLSIDAIAPRTLIDQPAETHDQLDQLSSQLAHDARNLIAAFRVSCEVLAAPGVLAPGFGHYAGDMRRMAESAGRLIEALAANRTRPASRRLPRAPGLNSLRLPEARIDRGGTRIDALEFDRVALNRHPFPGIEDLAAELMALEGPLRALAGQEVHLEIECLPCAGQLALNSEDLLRILFNLVANAVEAMALTPVELRRRPLLRITAQRGGAASFRPRHGQQSADTVVLAVRDNGPGIATEDLPRIFDSGFSTRRGKARNTSHRESGQAPRGLGLAIVRQLVAQAGGAVRVVSPSGFGTRFDIELPVISREIVEFRSALRPLKRKLPQLQQNSAQIEKEA